MISWLRRRFPLVLIMLIGILTPVAATLLFYLSPPSNNTARGEILLPQPLPADWNLNTGKWTLLYASIGKCLPPCQKRLCQMRQLRLMLPGSYLRLQSVCGCVRRNHRRRPISPPPPIVAKPAPPLLPTAPAKSILPTDCCILTATLTACRRRPTILGAPIIYI